MSRSTFLSTSSLSPQKMVLISFLIGILGFVVFWPEESSSELDIPTSRSSARLSPSAANKETSDSEHPRARWPEYNLATVLAANPFETILVSAPQPTVVKTATPKIPAAKPEENQEPTPEETTAIAEVTALELTHKEEQQVTPEFVPHDKVDIIYENATERVAVIDSRLVRVGDVLSEGRVVEITADHVIIEVAMSAD
ncbi:hypothetical protein Pla52o_40180 [Novipirellula galeiformis]|uniref:Uncharacterized protein n=1 Tax=Novipirellula galeiformis TaxID=2528004 RepID=A0A5C6CC57_9BACT|nr:hypothetical protein [Novipirellula galeiformis]TWU20986.1 hypothetical protein Pla52o_40180 [Novipirellula galeiformis]